MSTNLFDIGTLVITPGANKAISDACSSDSMSVYEQKANVIKSLVKRHQTGDYGDIDEDDARENNLSLQSKHPCRILSVYEIAENIKIWIITEWDRSATTILLPEEY